MNGSCCELREQKPVCGLFRLAMEYMVDIRAPQQDTPISGPSLILDWRYRVDHAYTGGKISRARLRPPFLHSSPCALESWERRILTAAFSIAGSLLTSVLSAQCTLDECTSQQRHTFGTPPCKYRQRGGGESRQIVELGQSTRHPQDLTLVPARCRPWL